MMVSGLPLAQLASFVPSVFTFLVLLVLLGLFDSQYREIPCWKVVGVFVHCPKCFWPHLLCQIGTVSCPSPPFTSECSQNKVRMWSEFSLLGQPHLSSLEVDQINPRPVLMIKEALWMDGWDWDGMGWDGMVIIGDRYSKSTLGDNKKLPIWMWKSMHQTALDLYLERSSSALPDPAGWFHRRLHKYPPSWRWKVFSYLYIARSCPLKLPCGLVAYVRCWCIYAELAIELGIRIFSYVFKWTESECPSLIKTLQIIVRDAPWHQFCSFFYIVQKPILVIFSQIYALLGVLFQAWIMW